MKPFDWTLQLLLRNANIFNSGRGYGDAQKSSKYLTDLDTFVDTFVNACIKSGRAHILSLMSGKYTVFVIKTIKIYNNILYDFS